MPHSQIRTPGSPPENSSGPRRALILAGGGMRVAYQAGVLRALFDDGLTFHHADGTSGGTMNLAMLLSGLTPEEMCARWRSLRVQDFASLMPLAEYLKGPGMMAMGDADGIREKVFPHLGIDVAGINAARGMDGTFNVCNFSRKTCEVVEHRDVDLDLLIAGISLPVFMPPVHKNGTAYTDAVWIKDANLMEAVRRGADELWLVWCIGNTSVYKAGIFNQYVHMIEMSANGALFEEFERIRELNDRIRKGDSPYGQAGPVRLHVIRPEYALPLDPEFFFGRISAAELISAGYADASRYLDTMKQEGLPFEPEVTQMQIPTSPGISFRETMSGPFALSTTDPEVGASAGKDNTTELAIHVRIEIADIDRFTADPEHAGRLTGHIDFTPFGQHLPAKEGVFNLFSPADQADTKLMVYELPFQHEGQSYYLAGKKEVHDDPGFDLWKDTTTLFTRLHRGGDKTGPVIGAGLLSLGVADLVKLVASMQATNASSVIEKTQTLAKFGRLFMGELWDTYVHHAQPASPPHT